MWFLVDKDGKTIELNENKKITIGRTNSDILLTKDTSISRSHATLEVEKLSDKSKSSISGDTRLIITDSKSKYGTYILQNNKEYQLKDKRYSLSPTDRIRFGLQHHIFTISYKSEKKYIVLTSGLTEKDKKDLEELLISINGEICNQWYDGCTHLTACTLGLTEKISCALASGIPIVNSTYWEDVLKAQEANEDIPDVKKYTPLFDNLLRGVGKDALLPNLHRKKLFTDLKFYFFDECQFKIYSTMIKLSNGESFMYDKSLKETDCIRENIVFIQPLSDSQSQSLLLSEYQSLNELLKKHQLRSIPASEIPLSILYCSLDQHCNPRFKYTKLLQSKDKEKQNKIATAKVLVPETQDWDDDIPKSSKNILIPETVPETQSLFQKLSKQKSKISMVTSTPKPEYRCEKPNLVGPEEEENSKKRKKINEIVPMIQSTDESPDNKKLKKKKLDNLDIIQKESTKGEKTVDEEESIWNVLTDVQKPEKVVAVSRQPVFLDSDSSQKTQRNSDEDQKKKGLTSQTNLIIREKLPATGASIEGIGIQDEDSSDIEEFQIKSESDLENRHDNDDENTRRVDKQDDHDVNDENQYSGNWIQRCRRNDNANNEMVKNLGYEVKYVSMTEIQKGYQPSTKKRIFKRNKSEPIKRLAREDFYEWIPQSKK